MRAAPVGEEEGVPIVGNKLPSRLPMSSRRKLPPTDPSSHCWTACSQAHHARHPGPHPHQRPEPLGLMALEGRQFVNHEACHTEKGRPLCSIIHCTFSRLMMWISVSF